MNILIKTLLISVALTFTTTSYSQIDDIDELRYYDVEVIIFEDTHARYLESEVWREPKSENENITNSEPSAIETPEETVSLFEDIPDKDPKTNIQSIEPILLAQQYERLRSSSQYTILFQSAWRQAGLTQDEAIEVNINDLVNSHESKSENSISGTIKVVLARYLHIYNQLEYKRQNIEKKEVASDSVDNQENNLEKSDDDLESQALEAVENTDKTEEEAAKVYLIENHRKMRSKELHYIDHPLIGILVQINPSEIESVESEFESIKPEDNNANTKIN